MIDISKVFEQIKYEEENISINVYLLKENNTIWLTQKDMTILFDINKPKVSRLLNEYTKELESGATVAKKGPTVAKSAIAQIEGERIVRRIVDIYTLDAILYVGYKTNPDRTDRFKEWSNQIIEDNNGLQNISNFSDNSYEIVRFEDGDFSLDVNVSPTEDTVWLSKEQICILFNTTRQNLEYHINNIYKQNELTLDGTCKKILQVQLENNRNVTRPVLLYNLDMIISLGYRINSKNGIIFRKWASSILKEYLLKGYRINENRCLNCSSSIIELSNKVELLETKMKKVEDRIYLSEFEIIYEGDVLESKILLRSLFLYAKKEIIIIDGYADTSLLELLNGINKPITIITFTNSKLNKVKLPSNIKLVHSDVYHDRFIIIDETAYLIGSSINTMGRKRSVMCKLHDKSKEIILRGII